MFDSYDDDNGSDKGHSRKDSDQYSGWVSPRSPTPLEDYEIRARAHNQTHTSTTLATYSEKYFKSYSPDPEHLAKSDGQNKTNPTNQTSLPGRWHVHLHKT